ncbi:ribonucleases P/MRP protein subunit POP1-domain-containing protein [Lasiosphaeria miniovina]|uniref:Ribonucleases P/MRP protein subunit POP1-domain-containing protein n=1 Tax=Lasiosphaeria miniovina TaxID=1954250 RepID=A0AA39ZTV2_9PEZI|nr:ribonucleases P/MRP protein subunit POP1-domain-containing protein [Lasiosphaeria miniovina]KAK0703481.1 ribonucleases P/MRP protein subunit POP1-domain-containing protein [Lasiosphaeria miniovina]
MDGRKKLTSSGAGASEARKRKEPPTVTGNNRNQAKGTHSTGRSLKRVKFQDARNIRTQPSDAALEDGRLDLQKFLNARQFEIKALESSMQKCTSVNATRVFQQVPRAMRRRTASHNVRRVPKRLRARARKEQIEDNTPTVEARKRRPRTTRARIRAETVKKLGILAAKKRTKQLKKKAASQGSTPSSRVEDTIQATVQTRAPRPKIRRNTLNEPPSLKSKFKRRQINKTWLPTHLWHAKRAIMTEPTRPLWRFAIPCTPTEKCYRPTHRASGQKGAVVWDVSYISTVGLYGLAQSLERMLKALGLTQEHLWSTRGQNWRAGLRKWTGLLSQQTKDTRRDIGPGTVIWNPEPPAGSVEKTNPERPKKIQRQVLIRTHPSCFLQLFNELVKVAKMQTPQVHVEDLRFEIGSIELTGPGSTETLLGVLQPYYNKPETEETHGRVFKSLAGVTNPASLPTDALLSFSAKDPRLSYPPKRVVVTNGSNDLALLELLTKWPVGEGLKPFDIFSRECLYRASQLPRQKSINRRKGSNAPGEAILVTAADPPIPVMLLASRPATGGQAQGTWTLLAPWKCIPAIWYSLMHYPLSTGGNPRLGGLDEQRQVAFEHGAPWFPGDFPGTDAGSTWELEQRAKRKRDWDRRPKGKRVEWKSLDLGAGRKGEIGDGLACDFEYLFGLPREDLAKAARANENSTTENPDAMDLGDIKDTEDGAPKEHASAHRSLTMVRQLSKTSFAALLTPSSVDKPPACSIITVNISFVARGVANPCARIYRLPTAQVSAVPPLSTETEVPSTEPPFKGPGSLPKRLRDQWLKLGLSNAASLGGGKRAKLGLAPPRIPPGADLEAHKRLLAASILTTEPLPYPKPAANQTDVGGHPLCPNEEDLIGFVTTGAFSLSKGRGTAIGSISAEKALTALKVAGGGREGKFCILRNAGESVGWLARWEAV